jgi:hypothetical protein
MRERYVAELRDIKNRSYSYGVHSFEAPTVPDAGTEALEWAKGLGLGTTVRLIVKPRDSAKIILDKVIYPSR